MAVYNTTFFLIKRAIDSVLSQDFQDFELIIIDDGSNDKDRKELLDYIEKHEAKIVYIRHSNRGQSESINRGVLNSIGKYITILDGDDVYKSNHLSACLQAVKNLGTYKYNFSSTWNGCCNGATHFRIPIVFS